MNTDLETRMLELLDKQAIHECLARFSRGMDRFDREVFLSAFHPDATVAAGPFVGSAAQCYDWAMPMHEAGQVATQHNLLNVTIDLDGDTAHTETYYQFVGRNRDETLWMAGGRYVDRLERRGGEWRISLRTNVVEWSGMLPQVPLPFTDVPGIDRNGVAARSPQDISYRRPLTNRRERHIP